MKHSPLPPLPTEMPACLPLFVYLERKVFSRHVFAELTNIGMTAAIRALQQVSVPPSAHPLSLSLRPRSSQLRQPGAERRPLARIKHSTPIARPQRPPHLFLAPTWGPDYTAGFSLREPELVLKGFCILGTVLPK